MKLMKVGELAKKVGVAGSTVRYYCQIGLISPDAKTDSGYSLFGPNQLERMAQIVQWRKQRLTIAEIREKLQELDALTRGGIGK